VRFTFWHVSLSFSIFFFCFFFSLELSVFLRSFQKAEKEQIDMLLHIKEHVCIYTFSLFFSFFFFLFFFTLGGNICDLAIFNICDIFRAFLRFFKAQIFAFRITISVWIFDMNGMRNRCLPVS